MQDPVRTNKIPRQVPEQPWYMNPLFSILIGGILPFGAVFIELFFILTSMWQHQVGDSCCLGDACPGLSSPSIVQLFGRSTYIVLACLHLALVLPSALARVQRIWWQQGVQKAEVPAPPLLT